MDGSEFQQSHTIWWKWIFHIFVAHILDLAIFWVFESIYWNFYAVFWCLIILVSFSCLAKHLFLERNISVPLSAKNSSVPSAYTPEQLHLYKGSIIGQPAMLLVNCLLIYFRCPGALHQGRGIILVALFFLSVLFKVVLMETCPTIW